jgi:hypothetical protein
MGFSRDSDGTLCITPLKYIEKMINHYEKIFGESPRQNVSSPLEKGDHPELNTSELLDSQGIAIFQSLIGALQWVITIGRFDVQTAVMTLSGFRVAPRRGHLDQAKRVYGYLAKMRHAAICVQTDEPDYSDIPDVNMIGHKQSMVILRKEFHKMHLRPMESLSPSHIMLMLI